MYDVKKKKKITIFSNNVECPCFRCPCSVEGQAVQTCSQDRAPFSNFLRSLATKRKRYFGNLFDKKKKRYGKTMNYVHEITSFISKIKNPFHALCR